MDALQASRSIDRVRADEGEPGEGAMAAGRFNPY